MLYVGQYREGRRDLADRADGEPRRSYRARRRGGRHRAGPRRSARPVAEAARAQDHRELRAPGLPADARGLLRARVARELRQAHAASARRVAVVARALRAHRLDEGLSLTGAEWGVRRACAPAAPLICRCRAACAAGGSNHAATPAAARTRRACIGTVERLSCGFKFTRGQA
ncbi:hypothetical protein BVI2075_260006 [Burkholderia vietnamiensis]|nr:hypothetical protein BVI1335_1190034 [Burkholderia vietnamiensis]CAG9198571.1 hypothetical protein BVI2075_260006 [Burkholderia vietnamiensis]